jgi:hypothetical protein
MNEFYTEIPFNHFWRIVHDNDRNYPLWSKFTIDEFNKLESLNKDPLHEEDAFTNKPESNCFILSFSTTHIENAESIEMDIYKTTDEWFYACVVNITSGSINYYKCDQFDGLLKLISSLDWNKVNESKEYYKEEYHSSRENNIEDFTPNEIDVIQHLYNKEVNINKKRIYFDYKCDQFDGLKDLLSDILIPSSKNLTKWRDKVNESKEEYYTKITYRDYYTTDSGPWVKLSDKELSILSKYGSKSSTSGYLVYRFKCDVEFIHSVGEAIIGVSKVDDEWFYVHFESTENNYVEYYKCDQFDGVIKLLSDKLIKEVREMKHLKLFESFENELFV